jgi:hypothetical protein
MARWPRGARSGRVVGRLPEFLLGAREQRRDVGQGRRDHAVPALRALGCAGSGPASGRRRDRARAAACRPARAGRSSAPCAAAVQCARRGRSSTSSGLPHHAQSACRRCAAAPQARQPSVRRSSSSARHSAGSSGRTRPLSASRPASPCRWPCCRGHSSAGKRPQRVWLCTGLSGSAQRGQASAGRSPTSGSGAGPPSAAGRPGAISRSSSIQPSPER